MLLEAWYRRRDWGKSSGPWRRSSRVFRSPLLLLVAMPWWQLLNWLSSEIDSLGKRLHTTLPGKLRRQEARA